MIQMFRGRHRQLIPSPDRPATTIRSCAPGPGRSSAWPGPGGSWKAREPGVRGMILKSWGQGRIPLAPIHLPYLPRWVPTPTPPNRIAKTQNDNPNHPKLTRGYGTFAAAQHKNTRAKTIRIVSSMVIDLHNFEREICQHILPICQTCQDISSGPPPTPVYYPSRRAISQEEACGAFLRGI